MNPDLKEFKELFKAHIEEDKRRFTAIDDSIKLMHTDLKEFIKVIQAIGVGKRFIIGLAIFIGSVVGIVIGAKQIINWFK